MADDTKAHSHHVVSLKVYLGVGLALFILTGVTVAVSFVDLGGFNAIIAVLIASVKASLVVLVYMHLKYDKPINAIIFIFAIMFLAIFISLTMFDVVTRTELGEQRMRIIEERAIIYEDTVSDTTSGAADSVTHGQDENQAPDH